MNFKKSTLIMSLLAGSLALSACDDKAQPTQPTTEKSATQQPVSQPQNAEVKITDVVSISTTGELIRNENSEPRIVLKSYVKNLSNKPITSVRWKNVVSANDQFLFFTDVPFKLNIAPQQAYDTSLVILESGVDSTKRAVAFSPDTNRTYRVEPVEVEFADGSKVTAK